MLDFAIFHLKNLFCNSTRLNCSRMTIIKTDKNAGGAETNGITTEIMHSTSEKRDGKGNTEMWCTTLCCSYTFGYFN